MRKWYLALMVLLLGTAAASAQGWAEKMFKGSQKHDFGTVPRGAQLKHSFTITNIYAVRMQITLVKSGCGCVSATIGGGKSSLEPNETTTVDVTMNARLFSGPKTVKVTVSVGPEYISSADLQVSANSRADVVFNPGEVNFGSVSGGQAPTQSIDVEYAGKLDWQVSEVVAREVPFTATITELYRRTVANSDLKQVGYRLGVTLKSDAPLGAFKHNVYLKTNDPASPLVPVLVEASVQSALSVQPSTLSLGAVRTDTALTRRVVVRGAKPFKVTAVEGAGNGIELGSPLSATEAEVQFLTFKCTFATPGAFRREVKIKTTLQEAPVSVVIEGTASNK
jgi:hypothetical protein